MTEQRAVASIVGYVFCSEITESLGIKAHGKLTILEIKMGQRQFIQEQKCNRAIVQKLKKEMIIKSREIKQSDIDELNALLALNLPENKRFSIERELRFIKSGDKGEKDSAYFIDFDYGTSKNWAIIHDLRLEHDIKVAQIDHLLINRFFHFYVLESKNYSYGVKITDDGEFLVGYNNKYLPIGSPIEQNKRHILLLEKVIKDHDIMPKRLGIILSPSFRNYVLVSTNSRVIRPPKNKFDTSMVIKADTLASIIEKAVDNMSSISVLASASKISSTGTLMEVAKKIAKLHKPIKMDYKKKFGIDEHVVKEKKTEKNYYCSKCKKPITGKVAFFCWQNKEKFGGRAYCFDCQKHI